MEKINIEVPLSLIASYYLKMGSIRQIFAAPHLNADKHDFFTVEVGDRVVDNETVLCFKLMNGGRVVREVVLNLKQIFDQALKIDEVLSLIKEKK